MKCTRCNCRDGNEKCPVCRDDVKPEDGDREHDFARDEEIIAEAEATKR